MKGFFLLALLAIIPLSAAARLGETEAEINGRYGTPVNRAPAAIPATTYLVDGWIVICDFVEGTCARVSYAKPGEWTPETFEKLLRANGDLSRWTESGPPSFKKLTRLWKRDDGAVAHWLAGSLIITSPGYEKAKAASEQEALVAARP